MSTCIIRESSPLERLGDRAVRFLTEPASARPLAVLRIGIAAVLLLQALAIAGDIQELFGTHGIVQWSALDPDQAPRTLFPDVPRIRWVVELLAPLGVSGAAAVRGVFLAYVAGLALMLVGWRSNIAAAVAWLTHLAMNVSGSATIYGVDQFANIALFYCTWMPVGAAYSLDRQSGRVSGAPTWTARLGLRVLQLHLCIAYLASGLEKGSGGQWWNGEAIWRALSLPELARFDFSWMASVPWLPMLLCWGTLAIEVGYAILVWPRFTRRWMALATISLHVGIGVTMSLDSFSAVMCVLTLSAFLISAETEERPAERKS